MILDYIFYRVYTAYCTCPHEGEPLSRSRDCLLALLQILILPIAGNIAVLYGAPNRITNVIPYFAINAVVYMIICKKYSKQRLQTILNRYEQVTKFKFPIFPIWILVAFSMVIGIILMVLLDFFVLGPLGLVGIFK